MHNQNYNKNIHVIFPRSDNRTKIFEGKHRSVGKKRNNGTKEGEQERVSLSIWFSY